MIWQPQQKAFLAGPTQASSSLLQRLPTAPWPLSAQSLDGYQEMLNPTAQSSESSPIYGTCPTTTGADPPRQTLVLLCSGNNPACLKDGDSTHTEESPGPALP